MAGREPDRIVWDLRGHAFKKEAAAHLPDPAGGWLVLLHRLKTGVSAAAYAEPLRRLRRLLAGPKGKKHTR